MSRPSNSKNLLLPVAVIFAAFAAVVILSSRVAALRPPLPAGFEDSDLAVQGKSLKGYLLGSEGLVADWYWIMSLQYLGSKLVNNDSATLDIGDLRKLNPRLLYPYLDNATDLDPKFTAAYSYGAVVLPAIDPNLAIKLTEKGIRNNPDNWRFYQYLGYIYWRQKDFDRAAKEYETGSKIPGAPLFMRQMVASMRTKGGDRETARLIYQQMLNESADEQSRRNAQMRLHEIDSLNERDAVNKALAEFKERFLRCPAAVSEIFPALRSTSLPGGQDFQIGRANDLVDPTGVPYVFDPGECKINLAPGSTIPRSE